MSRAANSQKWLLEEIQDHLRKLKSGGIDLDVARAEQVDHKHMIRLADVNVQTLRVVNVQPVIPDNGELPLVADVEVESKR